MALDSGFSIALLLLDFSAAFDCVAHTILLDVLQLQFAVDLLISCLKVPQCYYKLQLYCIVLYFTVLKSVVAHQKSFLYSLVYLKVQFFVHLFCTPPTL